MTEKTGSARSTGSHKMALLYIMKFLLEKTDEDHPANATALIRMLQGYGIPADRRTVYADVAVLTDFGLDILTREGKRGGYYIASREFELPELKLLVDAVQASRFITVRKSGELIDKLTGLTSEAQAKELHREVFLRDRLKTDNESIFYNVDSIYEAIHKDRQIAFQYGILTPEKRLVPRKDGARYQVSPWALTWDDENYYLIAYDELRAEIRHYRVDKMMKVRAVQEKREGGTVFRDFDLGAYARKTFGMFSGEEAEVTMICEKKLAGVIIDRFGYDVRIRPEDEDHFRIRVPVSVSPQFYGWITGIGKGIRIEEPGAVKIGYKAYLRELLAQYE